MPWITWQSLKIQDWNRKDEDKNEYGNEKEQWIYESNQEAQGWQHKKKEYFAEVNQSRQKSISKQVQWACTWFLLTFTWKKLRMIYVFTLLNFILYRMKL